MLSTSPAVFFAALSLGFAAFVSTPFAANGATLETRDVYTSISPEALLEILEAERGEIEVEVLDGDATLAGRVDGVNYDVFFYECDGGAFTDAAKTDSSCLGYEYRAYFTNYPSDGETVNQFNNDYHYGNLWRDEDGDLGLQLNVVVEGGITKENIRTTFAWWRAVIESFEDFMDGR